MNFIKSLTKIKETHTTKNNFLECTPVVNYGINTTISKNQENKQEEKENYLTESDILQNKIEFNDKMIEERNEEIKNILRDIQDINEIFKDLNKLSIQQFESINILENNVDSTVKLTEETIKTLKIAESYHRSWISKKNKFILFGIAGLSISTPLGIVLGAKIGICSGLSTIGLSALGSIIF
jgi:hypothetical protein